MNFILFFFFVRHDNRKVSFQQTVKIFSTWIENGRLKLEHKCFKKSNPKASFFSQFQLKNSRILEEKEILRL